MTADLVTDRYRLHLAVLADESHYIALYRNLDVMRAIGPLPQISDLRAAFGRVVRHNAARLPGHRVWIIQGRECDRPIGITALQRDGKRAELGIMLFADYWRRGVAREVFGPLLAYGFGTMGLDVVDAERRDDDQARVIDRLLHPFGFLNVAPGAPGLRRWALARADWSAAADNW